MMEGWGRMSVNHFPHAQKTPLESISAQQLGTRTNANFPSYSRLPQSKRNRIQSRFLQEAGPFPTLTFSFVQISTVTGFLLDYAFMYLTVICRALCQAASKHTTPISSFNPHNNHMRWALLLLSLLLFNLPMRKLRHKRAR